MKEITLKVRGMSCGHCVNAIEGSVGELQGVRHVKVDLQEARVSVSYDDSAVSLAEIQEVIEDQGYKVI